MNAVEADVFEIRKRGHVSGRLQPNGIHESRRRRSFRYGRGNGRLRVIRVIVIRRIRSGESRIRRKDSVRNLRNGVRIVIGCERVAVVGGEIREVAPVFERSARIVFDVREVPAVRRGSDGNAAYRQVSGLSGRVRIRRARKREYRGISDDRRGSARRREVERVRRESRRGNPSSAERYADGIERKGGFRPKGSRKRTAGYVRASVYR